MLGCEPHTCAGRADCNDAPQERGIHSALEADSHKNATPLHQSAQSVAFPARAARASAALTRQLSPSAPVASVLIDSVNDPSAAGATKCRRCSAPRATPCCRARSAQCAPMGSGAALLVSSTDGGALSETLPSAGAAGADGVPSAAPQPGLRTLRHPLASKPRILRQDHHQHAQPMRAPHLAFFFGVHRRFTGALSPLLDPLAAAPAAAPESHVRSARTGLSSSASRSADRAAAGSAAAGCRPRRGGGARAGSARTAASCRRRVAMRSVRSTAELPVDTADARAEEACERGVPCDASSSGRRAGVTAAPCS